MNGNSTETKELFMENKKDGVNRRTFFKAAVASTMAVALTSEFLFAGRFQSNSLQVWSCGGLSEAFMEVNGLYEQRNGIQINYMGAFAAENHYRE